MMAQFEPMQRGSCVLCVQDERLKELVERYGTNDWPLIASYILGRSEVHCQHRWEKFLDPQLIKGPWTKEVSCGLQEEFVCLQLTSGRRNTVRCASLECHTQTPAMSVTNLPRSHSVYNTRWSHWVFTTHESCSTWKCARSGVPVFRLGSRSCKVVENGAIELVLNSNCWLIQSSSSDPYWWWEKNTLFFGVKCIKLTYLQSLMAKNSYRTLLSRYRTLLSRHRILHSTVVCRMLV